MGRLASLPWGIAIVMGVGVYVMQECGKDSEPTVGLATVWFQLGLGVGFGLQLELELEFELDYFGRQG